MINNEIWKDVENYEGLYQVSSLGRVKSLNYNKTGEEKVLKPSKDKKGYLQVCLCKEGKHNTLRVHRLVAQTFIENPLNKPTVNHKDEDKTNNCIENLEWMTIKENNNYGNRKLKIGLSLSKPVLQYDFKGNFIQEFPSTRQIQRDLGFHQTHISAVCLGKRKTAHKFIWKYKEVD